MSILNQYTVSDIKTYPVWLYFYSSFAIIDLFSKILEKQAMFDNGLIKAIDFTFHLQK